MTSTRHVGQTCPSFYLSLSLPPPSRKRPMFRGPARSAHRPSPSDSVRSGSVRFGVRGPASGRVSGDCQFGPRSRVVGVGAAAVRRAASDLAEPNESLTFSARALPQPPVTLWIPPAPALHLFRNVHPPPPARGYCGSASRVRGCLTRELQLHASPRFSTPSP